MILADVGRALGQRLRRPAYWAAAIVFYLPYLQNNLRIPLSKPTPTPLALMAGYVLVPFLVVGTIVWLSPLPWQWNGKRYKACGFWRGLLQSWLFCEGIMIGLVLLGVGYQRLFHVDAPVWSGIRLFSTLQVPIMVMVGRIMAQREGADLENRRIQAEAEEAQSRLLQSQMHPHVLFNVLNGVAEMAHTDPASVEPTVRALSDLLRRLMWAVEQAVFTLKDERALVENYLAVEQLRLGSRLRVSWDWDGALDDRKVPPLLLQPLVENAIKHGIAPSIEGGELQIFARESAGNLSLGVRNTGAQAAPERERHGLGLRNLEARLALHGQGPAAFELRRESPWTVAEIRLGSLG